VHVVIRGDDPHGHHVPKDARNENDGVDAGHGDEVLVGEGLGAQVESNVFLHVKVKLRPILCPIVQIQNQ